MRHDFKRLIYIFLLNIFICCTGNLTAQTNNSPKNDTLQKKKSFFKKIWGDPLDTSITAMPIGLHTDFEKHGTSKRSTINGLHEALYFAVNYKSIEAIAFQNSFADLTVGLLYKRTWNFTKRFSVNFGLGVIYGYRGRLQNTEGIPFRDTFLIKGDINPVTGFELNYKIYKNWSINTNIAPRIIIYGFKYRL